MFGVSGEIFTPCPRPPGRIILLHGASSSGKSTLARALQAQLDEPFLHLSSDQLVGMLPARREAEGPFAWWTGMRPAFFHGFHRSIPAFAEAGNDLVVEHVIEFPAWRDELAALLRGFDVFLVGVHCNIAELDRRERVRGDRRIGEGRGHVEVDGIHTFGPYDLEVARIGHFGPSGGGKTKTPCCWGAELWGRGLHAKSPRVGCGRRPIRSAPWRSTRPVVIRPHWRQT